MPGRLMVGQQTLDPFMNVRIVPGQQDWTRAKKEALIKRDLKLLKKL